MTTMFEVTTLKECPTTGITTYEMKWSLGRGIQTDHGNFMNLEDARQYISSSKRSYILIMFDNFVHRARCHFEIGDSEYYQKESKLASLDRCIKYTQWFEGKELQTSVKVIMALGMIPRSELYNNFLEKSRGQRKFMNPFKFKKKILAWCQYHGVSFNPQSVHKFGKPGQDDKRGGVEYFTLSTNT